MFFDTFTQQQNAGIKIHVCLVCILQSLLIAIEKLNTYNACFTCQEVASTFLCGACFKKEEPCVQWENNRLLIRVIYDA